MEEHNGIIELLAQGFKESRKHIQNEETVRNFLDVFLVNRLSSRLLITHFLHLHDNKPGHVGIINLKMNLRDLISGHARFVQEITEDKYGHSPPIQVGYVTNTQGQV